MEFGDGVTREAEKAAAGGFTEDVRVTSLQMNESMRVRILTGPVLGFQVWAPYQDLDADGAFVQRWHILNVPKEDSILHQLANADTRIVMSETNQPAAKCKSRLAPQDTRLYTCFKRDEDDDKPVVRRLVVNYSTYEALKKLGSQESQMKLGFLAHGLIFMFDVFIGKRPKKSSAAAGNFNTEYYVEAVPATYNKFAEQIPIAALDTKNPTRKQISSNLLKLKVFTQVEMDAIIASKINLRDDVAPMTDEQIKAAFREKPLFLNAVNKDSTKVFPYAKLLKEVCDELGISTSYGGVVVKAQASVPTGSVAQHTEESGSVDLSGLMGKDDEPKETPKGEEMSSEEVAKILGTTLE